MNLRWDALGVALGIGMTFAGTLLLVYEYIWQKTRELLGSARQWFREHLLTGAELPDKREWCIAVGTGLLIMGMGNSYGAVFSLFILGMASGLIGIRVVKHLGKAVNKKRRIKEIAVFLEAVELYIQADYSLIQAVQAAKLLTPTIQKELDRCLDAWPVLGPKRALMQLSKDLGVPEADILTTLLSHIEEAGSKYLHGILEREARSIQRLQKTRAEMSLQNRPIILMLYRFLPLIADLGIVGGALLYRAYAMMNKAGIAPF